MKSSVDRTKNANVNTIISLVFKSGSVLLQFALIPLTIKYLNPNVYGVWLTIASLLGWMSIFDIGIGNGLKNKLAQSLATNDFEKAKIYVSTTYVLISIIMVSLIVLFIFVYKIINWQLVFNSRFIDKSELDKTILVVFVFFLLKLISDLINVVSASYQMVSVNTIQLFISNVLMTFFVWVLKRTTIPSLLNLAICISVIPFLISLIFNFYLFNKKFQNVKPSLKCIDFKESKEILTLGSQFFILQIISLIIFQTDNILIVQLFSPLDVTNFNVSYKYFSVISILFSIIITPYWTAFTDAYHKNDYEWIKSSMKKLYKYWFLSVVVLVIMLLISKSVIKIWIGSEVNVSFGLALTICAYIAITNWNSILGNFLNGVGKIRIQIYLAIFIGVINIPISIILVKRFHWGLYAMPFSNFFCLLFGAVICFIQYRKIVEQRATGIWFK